VPRVATGITNDFLRMTSLSRHIRALLHADRVVLCLRLPRFRLQLLSKRHFHSPELRKPLLLVPLLRHSYVLAKDANYLLVDRHVCITQTLC
jgi:hypothetical protein